MSAGECKAQRTLTTQEAEEKAGLVQRICAPMKTSRRQPIGSLKSHMEIKAIFRRKSVLRHSLKRGLKFQVTTEMSFPDKGQQVLLINYY